MSREFSLDSDQPFETNYPTLSLASAVRGRWFVSQPRGQTGAIHVGKIVHVDMHNPMQSEHDGGSAHLLCSPFWVVLAQS